MSSSSAATDGPSDDPLAAQRSRIQHDLEASVGTGAQTLDEFGDRATTLWNASTTAELAEVAAGLESPPERRLDGGAHIRRQLAIFGNVQRRGRFHARSRGIYGSVFGHVVLDLQRAVITDPDLDLALWSIYGDAVVEVPEGVEVDVLSTRLFGHERVEIADRPRNPGTPRVRIRAATWSPCRPCRVATTCPS